jgi:hypothetical protein
MGNEKCRKVANQTGQIAGQTVHRFVHRFADAGRFGVDLMVVSGGDIRRNDSGRGSGGGSSCTGFGFAGPVHWEAE